MKLLHSSDLHGDLDDLFDVMKTVDFDVWVDTGDFFPNVGRPIISSREEAYQKKWFDLACKDLKVLLKDKTVITCGGNHDFADLHDLLAPFSAVQQIKSGSLVTINGTTFAGFREIPFLIGEWNGEERDLSPFVDTVMNLHPDVLVTHTPPSGILDSMNRYGASDLTTALTYRAHKIKTHLFGHIHENGGSSVEEMGIKFYNGARHVRLIDL